ncbi:MAG: aminotransferase class I/II-fold pyridoxal phosphate-dependent enzyme [Saprospiraceae bacterium]|nr:aminotransferase class I/II-fold pyridoxal phosphate-dependent enzyme [Saprospiraceae bacterium]
MNLSYILNELGEDRHEYYNAIAPPIVQTSNFSFDTVDELRSRLHNEYSGYLYSRGHNPTVDILRKKLAALDGAEDALVFNSGAAAIFSSVVPFVESGDQIIAVSGVYTWAQKLFDSFLPKFGINTQYVEGKDPEEFRKKITDQTKIIYLESPNSWDFRIQDVKAISQMAKEKGILTVVDNSYCTALFQKPIEMGIDLVLQSATKYIGGHSDVVAGVLSGRKTLLRKIFDLEYLLAGNGIQPFNAWLLLRGLRTLPVRLEAIQKTTQNVLRFLKQREEVEKLFFPLDPDFDQFNLANSQMSGACGLLSIVLKCKDLNKIERFCEELTAFKMAVSWGGHESLIIPRCAGLQRMEFDGEKQDHRMIRFYIGLENSEYLISDLENAFKKLS